MTNTKPRELLSDHELIGFTRPSRGGDRVARRASSAKVTETADPVKVQIPTRATERSYA